MNKNNGQVLESKISNSVKKKYFSAVVIYTVLYLVAVALAYFFLTSYIWYADDVLYIILSFIKRYFYIFLIIPLVIGWLIISGHYLKKPLQYLDEVIYASEQLAKDTDEQIILSSGLKTVQDEFNSIREAAIKDKIIAKEAEQRKNDMIVYLAHDLKTPLTSVIGYLTLLKDEGQISEELKERYLSISLEKAERLEDLINEFFDITRFNLSHIELQYSRVNLTRLLEQLIYEFQPILLEKNQSCELEADPDVMIRCDVNKMQRVFDNLLRNAAYYGFDDSTVKIKVAVCEKETTIIFINDGDTIPPEKLSRIFEQFYRLDSSRRTNNGGAGLGLAISKQIIELHSGIITAESENEKIVFTVTLPNT